MKERALFLDRDGIITRMVKYRNGFDSPQRAEDVKLVDGVHEVIRVARDKGWKVIEISNQPGVAKGKQTQQLSDRIEAMAHTLLKQTSASIDAYYICYHHPQGVIPGLSIECDCRKPKPGLLLKAAADNNINLAMSLFYGDKASDVQAGKAAGCKTMILLHSEDTPDKVLKAQDADADFKVNSHKEAVFIISRL